MGVRVLLRLTLAFFLVGFLFEGAVHSVHHLLDDDEQAAECWVASAAGNVSIITSPQPVVLDAVPIVVGTVVERDRPGPSSLRLDVGRGRAPPSVLSA